MKPLAIGTEEVEKWEESLLWGESLYITRHTGLEDKAKKKETDLRKVGRK